MTFSIKCPQCGAPVGSGGFTSKDENTDTLHLSISAESGPPHQQTPSQPTPAPTQEQT